MIQTLQEVCSHVVDCKNRTAPEDPTGKYFAVGTPAMRGNVINYAEARRIDESTFAEWTARLLPREGDILFAREAPVGPVVSIPAGGNVAAGQRTMLLRTDPEKADSDFLRLYLSAPLAQARILALAHGSTTPHLRVADVRSFPVDLPTLNEQKAIATVLCVLDDKIAANTKLVSLLDDHMGLEYTATVLGSASALPLNDVAEFQNRKRVPLSARERDQRRGDVPYYGASGVFGTVDTAIFDEPLVLVGEDGSVINSDGTPVTQYIWGPAWVNNHAHVLTGKGISTELLFLAIKRTQVATLVTGAVQPKINMGNLKRLTLEIPSMERRGRLEQIVKAETASKRAAIEENRTLAATRDALLPQLMSGKLRVKEAEAMVAAAV